MNNDRLLNHHGRAADTPPRSTTRRRAGGRNAGASLIEVLVVLVVILIGIFAIIQIFPIGFTSLKKSEARLRADRLTRNVTESLNVDSSGLPESITFSYYDANGIRQTVTSEDPDNLGTYQNDPANKLYFSDLNKFRYVSNEPIRVPLPTATSATGFGNAVGSIHFLTFGPIFMNATVGDRDTAPTATTRTLYHSYLKITSEKLSGAVVEAYTPDTPPVTTPPTPNNQLRPASEYAGYLRGANTYVLDHGDETSPPVIMFAPQNKERTFSVTYSHEDESTTPSTVVTVTVDLVVPAATGTGRDRYQWIQLGTQPILAGSESVVRDFTRLPFSTAWDSDDPYQYKLASENVSPNANLGVVAFNPAGANFSVSVPGGTKPFTALASYAVLDWHILRDDREVPDGSGNVAKVRTSLPSIRLKGDEFVDLTATGADRTQVYPGLYPQVPIYRIDDRDSNDATRWPNDTISPDLQVFNLSDRTGTARLLVAGDLANRTTTDAAADYWINRAGRGGTYPTGTIYINTDKVPAGSKVRILYKAQGDWGVAFQKAAKAYRYQEDTENPGRPVQNQAEVFAVDPGAAGNGDDRIYFHLSELNKGVTAVFEVDTAAGTTRLPARQFTIQNADTANPDRKYSFALASEIAPEITRSGVTGWRIYGNVSGASLKTRVIWQDEQNGRNPWRVSDLETYVTRQGQ